MFNTAARKGLAPWWFQYQDYEDVLRADINMAVLGCWKMTLICIAW